METLDTRSEPTAALAVATGEPILVATDGTPQSKGALVVGRALAARLHADVELLTVCPQFLALGPEAQLLIDAEATVGLRADLRRRVNAQCAAVAGNGWPARGPDVREGDPPRVISHVAAEWGAQLVVVGLGRHDVKDRIFGEETALKVARSSRVPVLAVPVQSAAAFKQAVVGVDFTEASIRAAQTALRLVDDNAVVQLVHVVPRERMLVDAWISREEYDQFLRRRFTWLRAQLRVPRDVHVEDLTIEGDPARALLSLAARSRADLIAAGSHGHGFLTRMVVGSVTTALLRGATCAVLVAPRDDFREAHTDTRAARVRHSPQCDEWRELLDDFTRRNFGRRTRLEVDDPSIGAQGQEQDYPLLGVSYDTHDRRIQIMLGHVGVGLPHLTRGIGDADALDVLTDDTGRDAALRVRHGAGQTILTLVP